MTDSTAMNEMSRGVPEKDGMTAKDDAARRVATMDKVIVRTKEVADRVKLITEVLGPNLTDMIAKDGMGTAIDYLAQLDTAIDSLVVEAKAMASKLAYAKEVSMPARMDLEEVKTFNTEDNRITRTSRVYASIITDMAEKAYAWLRGKGYDALIKETVNSSALSAAAKELMAEGFELPEDMFTTHIKDGVSITRKKKA